MLFSTEFAAALSGKDGFRNQVGVVAALRFPSQIMLAAVSGELKIACKGCEEILDRVFEKLCEAFKTSSRVEFQFELVDPLVATDLKVVVIHIRFYGKGQEDMKLYARCLYRQDLEGFRVCRIESSNMTPPIV